MQTIGQHLDVLAHVAERKNVMRGPHMPFGVWHEVSLLIIGLCANPKTTARLGRLRAGNMEINPQIGILFIDFDTGDTLQLTGTGSVLWDERNLPGVPCLTS